MSEKSINKALYKLARSVLNQGLYQRHESDKMLVPFMFLKTKTTEELRNLEPDADSLQLAQTIIHRSRKNYTYIIIANEASLNDVNGNRVEAIIINAFDLSLRKGIQIAQKFNPKNTGDFKKIGPLEILETPDLIFRSQKSNKTIIQHKPHFNTEIKNDTKNLSSVHTELAHHDPSSISEVIHSFILDKLSHSESKHYNGLFEINIKETKPIKKVGLLRFLCSNAINELLGSETSHNWMKKTERKLIIICNYNNAILYQAQASNHKPVLFKLDEDNYKDFTKKQLDREFKSVQLDVKKTANIKLIMKLSQLNLEYTRRGIARPTAVIKNKSNKHNHHHLKNLTITSLAFLFTLLAWFLLKKE